MWTARMVHQAASWLAVRAGRVAMAQELRGHSADYDVPYLLSLLRDRAAAAYTRWRTP